MNAGHGGKSGRDGAIEEIALDYAFILKISKKIWFFQSWKNHNNSFFLAIAIGTIITSGGIGKKELSMKAIIPRK